MPNRRRRTNAVGQTKKKIAIIAPPAPEEKPAGSLPHLEAAINNLELEFGLK